MAELGVHQSALLTDLALCINRYRLFSPGWSVCVMAKVQLSAEEWEVPGLVAMVNYGRKKQCEVRDEVFQGPPNFVLDVFDSPDDEDFLRRRDRLHRTRCLASCRLQLMAMRTWIGLLALRNSWEPSGVSAV